MTVPLNLIASGFPRCGTQSFAQYILRCTDLRYIRDPQASSMDYAAFEAGKLTEYFQSALKLGRPTFHKNNSYVLNGQFTSWFSEIPEILEKTHIVLLIGDSRSRLVSWYKFHRNNKERALEAGEQLSGFLKSLNTDSLEEYYKTFAKYGLDYQGHLDRLVTTFGAEKVHVIRQEDLLEYPFETIGSLANTLGFKVTNTSRTFKSNSSNDLKYIEILQADIEKLGEEMNLNDERTRLYCLDNGLTISPSATIDILSSPHLLDNNIQANQFSLQTVSLQEDKKPLCGNVLVVGNGPSAALLNFGVLQSLDIHTVGMNSAYRLWNKISYRPTYYACLDTVVIMSHADAIYELVLEGRIRRFLLRDEILSKYPGLKDNPCIQWFSDVSQEPLKPLFHTDFITTGSWSLRWMADLGYQIIGCIGIDAKYLQLISEAQATDDGVLKITNTPKYNPNYFFDDYQKEGDSYNIPNDPGYLALQGGNVHQDALLQVRQDADVYTPSSLIVDLSPISDHGAFAKCSFNDFISHCSATLVTTFFYSEGKEDEFCLNIEALFHNLSVPQLTRIVLLFEGDLYSGLCHAPDKLKKRIEAAISTGTLLIVEIDKRPNYFQKLASSLKFPSAIIIVANSDIIFKPDDLSSIISYKSKTSAQTVFALTRWNITSTGVYPQGQVPTPPWQEKSIDEMKSLADINYLSYDTYVFDSSQIPADILTSIYVGTFGCDTALAAILRISGFYVINPCISLKTHHIDNKPRNYSSETGTKQVTANVNAFSRIFREIYSTVYDNEHDLTLLADIDRSIVSIGMPRPPKHLSSIGWWYAFLRLFGFTPWSSVFDDPGIQIQTFEIDASSVIEEPDALASLIQQCMRRGNFLEFHILGDPGSSDYLACFLQDYNLEQLRGELFRYDRQCVCNIDLLTPAERRSYDRIMLLIKDMLYRGGYNKSISLFYSNSGGRHPNSALSAYSLKGHNGQKASQELKLSPPGSHANPASSRYRVLIIDPTPIGSYSATGQVKTALLGFVEPSSMLQVWEHEGEDPGYRLYSPVSSADPNQISASVSYEDLIAQAKQFRPSLIYFRSTCSERLHVFHHLAKEALSIPSIIHVMDDWPFRLATSNPIKFASLGELLRKSIDISCLRLSISAKMSKRYSELYGGNWIQASNAVDRAVYDKSLARLKSIDNQVDLPIRLCYMGGLAADMNAQSLLDIARAITDIRSTGIGVELDVYTMPWYKAWAETNLLPFDGVSLFDLVHSNAYLSTIASYHCSIIAYNFDDLTISYASLSMANKLPEILAAGSYLFAYGPASFATIEYISENRLGSVVSANSYDDLVATLAKTIQALADGSIRSMHRQALEFARTRHSLKLLHANMRRYFDLALKIQ